MTLGVMIIRWVHILEAVVILFTVCLIFVSLDDMHGLRGWWVYGTHSSLLAVLLVLSILAGC